MDVDGVLGRINEIIAREFEVPLTDVVPSARLREDLGLDSLDGLDLIVALEAEFDIRLDDKAVKRLQTVGEIHDYVREVAVRRPASAVSEAEG